jgi:acetylornithine deacetylase/succinyl-diaminopimelate desuccinylase-like protein
MQNNQDKYAHYFKENKDHILRVYFDLLKIPSISTDPEHEPDCKKAALYVESFLNKLDFQTEVHLENKNYLVFATRHIRDDAPTVCFYGHTDVQPCDPLNLWTHPPFDPVIKDNKVYARGAQDNKGQLCYTLCAIEAVLKTNPSFQNCNIKLIIEGEEESGSHGTEIILKKIKDKLKCDELYVVDFDAKSSSIPSIVLGMRGLCAFEFTVKNGFVDLHSGMYGGVVYNPIRAISEMLASCFDDQGFLTIPGAYDGLMPLSEEDMKVIDFSFDPKHLETSFGVKSLCVPQGKKPKEANWLLPTFEINGLSGGYTAKGVKTVLPKEATAKISCRLGKGQNPHHFVEACHKYLSSKLPQGMSLEFHIHQAASSFYTTIKASSVMKAKKALESSFNHQAWIGLSGASVPIVGLLSELATKNIALMGVGLDTDNIHAPDEHFSLDRFEKGFYSIIHILTST